MYWHPELSRSAKRRQPSPTPENQSAEFSTFALHIVFTTWPGTLAALQLAVAQSQLLEPRIIVWAFQQIPRQFSAGSPPVATEFLKRRLRALARKCCPKTDVQIRVCLCTNQQDCMKTAFPQEGVLMVGGRKRWWRTREEKMAGFLRSCGHHVLFVATNQRRFI
jgi:hypothetical protein